MGNVLVIAPHPDDEVLGVGGSVLRHAADGDAVHVVLCTRGRVEDFGVEQVERVRAEARAVHQFLGLAGSHFLDLPAARLDTVPRVDIHAALHRVFEQVKPDTVYVPHPGDVHHDHRVMFEAAMVCCRPTHAKSPDRILAYETVSETDWNAPGVTPPFVPNCFVDISKFMDRKLEACAMYASQLRPAPNQRSLEALRALAITRGHSMGMPYAEAFVFLRRLVR